MSSIGNKIVLSKNLRRLMAEHNVDRAQMCKDIEIVFNIMVGETFKKIFKKTLDNNTLEYYNRIIKRGRPGRRK